MKNLALFFLAGTLLLGCQRRDPSKDNYHNGQLGGVQSDIEDAQLERAIASLQGSRIVNEDDLKILSEYSRHYFNHIADEKGFDLRKTNDIYFLQIYMPVGKSSLDPSADRTFEYLGRDLKQILRVNLHLADITSFSTNSVRSPREYTGDAYAILKPVKINKKR